MPGFDGDRVRFRLHASAPENRPTDVTGTFHVRHLSAKGTPRANFAGRVDCLFTGGRVAIATGIITRGAAPGLPDAPELAGHRVALTIEDHGNHDHLGWSWYVRQFHDVPGCTGTAPFFSVATGNFTLRKKNPVSG